MSVDRAHARFKIESGPARKGPGEASGLSDFKKLYLLLKNSSTSIAYAVGYGNAARGVTAELDTCPAAVTDRSAGTVHVLSPILLRGDDGEMLWIDTLCVVTLMRYLVCLRVPQGQACSLLLGHRNDDMGVQQVVLAVDATLHLCVRRGATRACSRCYDAVAVDQDMGAADLGVQLRQESRSLPKVKVMSHGQASRKRWGFLRLENAGHTDGRKAET